MIAEFSDQSQKMLKKVDRSVQLVQSTSSIRNQSKLRFWMSTIVFTIMLAMYTLNVSGQGSAITPINIFNAGYNLGLLVEASGASVQSGTYDTWAANTSAEWTTSWTPMPAGYASAPLFGSYPLDAVIRYEKQIELMMTYSTLCKDPFLKASPWSKHALKIYRAGYNLGRVNVLTAMECLECLKSPLYYAGVDLYDLGLETENTIIAENGIILTTLANGITRTTSISEDIATLQALRGLILTSLALVNIELPTDPQPCGPIPSADSGTGTSPFDGSPLGKWKSSYGDLDFEKDSDGTLRSSYGGSNGRLLVHFNGPLIEGIWVKDYPKPYCPISRIGINLSLTYILFMNMYSFDY